MSQQYAGADLADIDLEALARQLGDDAAVDARTLAELESTCGIRATSNAAPTVSCA